MQPVFLSDIELYYSTNVREDVIEISGEEHHHIKDVMRHKVDDIIYVTDGKGTIYKSKIDLLEKKFLQSSFIEKYFYPNLLSNITFCIPRLRTAERFEFALEKCVELGITNFIVFDSKRTVAKGEKLDRWQKIATAAMKQSLRAWLPNITYCKSVSEILKLSGTKVFFDQQANQPLNTILNSQFLLMHPYGTILNYLFLFGPEGGFADEELQITNGELRIILTPNRLRSETAIIAAATEISLNLQCPEKG